MSVYTIGIGDQLINPENYNNDIVSFLEEERMKFISLSNSFSIVLEAGCMTGRYLETFLGSGKKYIGVDIVKRYIETGRILHKHKLEMQNAQLLYANINKLNIIFNRCLIKNVSEILIVFPFNSFGNITDIQKTIKSLSDSKASFIISTYLTSDEAIDSRLDYYTSSRFSDIKIVDSEKGIFFKSKDGLNSIAYHQHWLEKAFGKYDIKLKSFKVSTIGIMYTNIDLEIID